MRKILMEADILFKQFRSHDIINLLSPEEAQEVYEVATFHKAWKSDLIYSSSEEIDRIYFVIKGRIKIAYCLNNKVEVLAEILVDGDLFGEFSLRPCINHLGEFSQVLSDETILFSIKLKDFHSKLISIPALNMEFSKKIVNKLKIVNGKFSDLVFKDVRARVLNFFMKHARYEGKMDGNKAEIKMFCTHQDIADFTASTRQTVSTIINSLIKEKLIIYEGRGRLIIPDLKKLSEYCQ